MIYCREQAARPIAWHGESMNLEELLEIRLARLVLAASWFQPPRFYGG